MSDSNKKIVNLDDCKAEKAEVLISKDEPKKPPEVYKWYLEPCIKEYWIRPEKRLAIYLRDDFMCVFCGADLRNIQKSDPFDITLDHVKCRAAGGSDHESNLITACRSCNFSRGNLPLYKYADKSTRATIRRNTRRRLYGYLQLAKHILSL